jgi:hypothetical protein
MSSIKQIRNEIIEKGYENELSGITEKEELLTLLQKARTTPKQNKSKRKVNTIILAEHHEDMKCMIKNSKQLMSILVPEGVSLAKNKFLLVSEGRGINPCYEALGLPVERTIQENIDARQTIEEMINKLLLQQQLIFGVANGKLKNGSTIPNTNVVISKEWFISRALNDGFKELLEMIDNGIKLYNRMIDESLVTPSNLNAVNETFKEILTKIIGVLDEHLFRIEKDILSKLIASNSHTKYENFLDLLTYFRTKRDSNIIRRVEDRVRSEESVEVVIIIFGQIHFENLKSLIEQSDILKFDTVKSLTFGGFYKKYLKYKAKYFALKKINI